MKKPFDAKDPSTWALKFPRPLSQGEIDFYGPQVQAGYDAFCAANKIRAEHGMPQLEYNPDPAPVPASPAAVVGPFVVGGGLPKG